jgi:hypothetical protein
VSYSHLEFNVQLLHAVIAPGKLELQLEMDKVEQSSGEFAGAASWLAEGLKIEEDQ